MCHHCDGLCRQQRLPASKRTPPSALSCGKNLPTDQCWILSPAHSSVQKANLPVQRNGTARVESGRMGEGEQAKFAWEGCESTSAECGLVGISSARGEISLRTCFEYYLNLIGDAAGSHKYRKQFNLESGKIARSMT